MKTKEPITSLRGLELEIEELIDGEEFYDLLPGNGEDDYICQWLRERVHEISGKYRLNPKYAMDAIVAAKKGEVR